MLTSDTQAPCFPNQVRNKQVGSVPEAVGSSVLIRLTPQQIKVLFLQSATSPPNTMPDSPQGQPDFRLQQYLVAVKPYCTNCSQSWLIVMTPALYRFKTGSCDSNQSKTRAGISICVCLALRPMRAVSTVGQAGWEELLIEAPHNL